MSVIGVFGIGFIKGATKAGIRAITNAGEINYAHVPNQKQVYFGLIAAKYTF